MDTPKGTVAVRVYRAAGRDDRGRIARKIYVVAPNREEALTIARLWSDGDPSGTVSWSVLDITRTGNVPVEAVLIARDGR